MTLFLTRLSARPAPVWSPEAAGVTLVEDHTPLHALSLQDTLQGPVLVLTANRCPHYLQWLRELHWSVLVGPWPPEALAEATRLTGEGREVYRGPELGDVPRFCPRERLVLYAAAQGLDNHEIARLLGVRVKSVANVLSELLELLHLHNRVQAALYFRGCWPPEGLARGSLPPSACRP